MAAEGAFQQVKFGAQQADLGAQIVFQWHAGDEGELRQHLAPCRIRSTVCTPSLSTAAGIGSLHRMRPR